MFALQVVCAQKKRCSAVKMLEMLQVCIGSVYIFDI